MYWKLENIKNMKVFVLVYIYSAVDNMYYLHMNLEKAIILLQSDAIDQSLLVLRQLHDQKIVS